MERYAANRIFPSSIPLSGLVNVNPRLTGGNPPSAATETDVTAGETAPDFPDISELVDAIEKSKRAFDHLAAHGSMLPSDFLALHRIFEEARFACDAVMATIQKTTAANGHEQEPADAR